MNWLACPLRALATVCVALMLILVHVPACAQEAELTGPPSANDLHEFTRLLADERIQKWIQSQADDAKKLAPADQPTLREQFETALGKIRTRVGDLAQAWNGRKRAPEVIAQRWHEQITADRQVRSLTFIVIFLFVGAGLEWLVRQYTNPMRRRIEARTFAAPRQRIYAALSRAALALSGLFVFAVGSIGAFSAFNWPPLLHALIINTLVMIVAVRAIGTVLVLFLAPFVPRLRLVPMSTPVARVIGRTLFILSVFLFSAVALIDVFKRLANTDGAEGNSAATLAVSVAFGMLCLAASLVGIMVCFKAVRRHASSISKAAGKWRAYLSILACGVFLLWLFDLHAAMWAAVFIGLLLPTLKLVGIWVDSAFDRSIAEYLAQNEPALKPETPDADAIELEENDEAVEAITIIDPYETYRPIAHRLVRFTATFTVFIALASLWDLGMFEDTENPTVIQQVFSVLIDSAAAILIADLVWTWGKTAIDRRLAAYKPPQDGSAPGPEARMATLLPLLRVVLMVTLLIMVVMSILSSLGVNIAPLLAGASVLGIAIGFGAQSLVKDVVSGIFFLVDDAFRVGEYVEIDQLRGTVEKISIRSLQIRHHRGAVHTLPFGELKSMTNYSRDWVIMKLEFRVPFDTDLGLVKKLVKQVGAELKANPDYGDSIIETLKSQGVRRMEEFNMVVGVKFMTRPGEQWLVRRDAYQKVRDIFDANGIRMAERNVKVEISGDEHLTDAERKAVSAAAQEAVNNPIAPGIVPDEP